MYAKDVACVVIVLILAGLYAQKKVNKMQLILLSWSIQTYYFSSIGRTITPLFFIVVLLTVEHVVLKSHEILSDIKRYRTLIVLPIITTVCALLINIFIDNTLIVQSTHDMLGLGIFYAKNYLLLLCIPWIFLSDTQIYDIESLFYFLKRIGVYSCLFALFQFIIHMIFNNEGIDFLIGIPSTNCSYSAANINLLRVNALFSEPKNLGAFMGIIIPIFIRSKEYKNLSLAVITGFLTLSQTFYVVLLLEIVLFVIFYRLKRIRLMVAFTLVSVIFLLSLVPKGLPYLLKITNAVSSPFVEKIFVNRLIGRYNMDELVARNNFLGMPLQPDLEMPVVSFFIEHPVFLISGYGYGGNVFMNNDYYLKYGGLSAYQERLEKRNKGHMNMRWFYYIALLGLPSFAFFFYSMTKCGTGRIFVDKYYALSWLILFFSEIEILVIVLFVILYRMLLLKHLIPIDENK